MRAEERLAQCLARIAEADPVLQSFESWQDHGREIEAHAELMDPAVLKRLLRGRNMTAQDYATALKDRMDAQDRVPSLFDGIDALLTPTVPMPAIPVTEVDEDELPFNRYTRAVNYLDLCALSVPAGFSTAIDARLPLPQPAAGEIGGRARLMAGILPVGSMQGVGDDLGSALVAGAGSGSRRQPVQPAGVGT